MTAPPTTATRPPLTPCPARRRHRPTPTPWPARHRHTRLLQKCNVSATGATSFSPHLPAVPYPTPILPRLHPHPNPHPTPHQALRHRRPGTREAQRGAGGGGGRGGADETDRHAQGEESGGLRHAVRSPLPPLSQPAGEATASWPQTLTLTPTSTLTLTLTLTRPHAIITTFTPRQVL